MDQLKSVDSLVVSDLSGILRTYYPVVPNKWQGEHGCLVGPFSSRAVAEYFSNYVVDLGPYPVSAERILAKGDAYYVEVQRFNRS